MVDVCFLSICPDSCVKVNKTKGVLRNCPQLDDDHVVLEKED